MKRALSILIVVVAGVVGLYLLFSGPGATERQRFLITAAFFLLAGALLGWRHARTSPGAWAAAATWTTLLLGVVGIWISATEPASGDWPFALTVLLAPLAAALVGSRIGVAVARRP